LVGSKTALSADLRPLTPCALSPTAHSTTFKMQLSNCNFQTFLDFPVFAFKAPLIFFDSTIRVIVTMIFTMIIIPILKSTAATNMKIHHLNTTFMCSRSIAGVPFDNSVGRFRANLRTICVPAVRGRLAVWRYDKSRTKNHSDK